MRGEFGTSGASAGLAAQALRAAGSLDWPRILSATAASRPACSAGPMTGVAFSSDEPPATGAASFAPARTPAPTASPAAGTTRPAARPASGLPGGVHGPLRRRAGRRHGGCLPRQRDRQGPGRRAGRDRTHPRADARQRRFRAGLRQATDLRRGLIRASLRQDGRAHVVRRRQHLGGIGGRREATERGLAHAGFGLRPPRREVGRGLLDRLSRDDRLPLGHEVVLEPGQPADEPGDVADGLHGRGARTLRGAGQPAVARRVRQRSGLRRGRGRVRRGVGVRDAPRRSEAEVDGCGAASSDTEGAPRRPEGGTLSGSGWVAPRGVRPAGTGAAAPMMMRVPAGAFSIVSSAASVWP